MTETIDTANLRALAEAADAQPYNIIATGYYTVAMNKLKAQPDQVVALLDRLAAAEARNATLTDDAARWQYVSHTMGDYCVVDALNNTIGVLKGAALDAVVDAAIQARAAAMKEKTP